MVKITLSIEGMKCVKCEAHMDEAIRKAFQVEKVTSSHERKETEIIAAKEIEDEKLQAVVTDAGYKLLGIETVPYEKKGLFGFFRK